MKNNVIYGVGFIGTELNVRNNIKCYDMWRGMLRRCYDEKFLEKRPSYKGCSVCKEWFNYSNFKKWYEENYYEIPNEKMCLDKDILIKNNKIYSPTTCCICPARINTLFTKRKNDRNKNGIIGVGEDKHIIKGKTYIYYRSRVNINGKAINCAFKTIEEAFNDYKYKKETEIKRIAKLYKDKIPKVLYDAMYNYKVEITD